MPDDGDPLDDDDLGFGHDDKPAERGFAERVIPDVVRKTLLTGVSAVLLGEEGLRGSINDMRDMKMPKEAMSYIVAQADRTKREAINALARELRQFLDSLDLQGLIEKSLAGTTIEINTTVRVIEGDEGGVGLEVLEKDTAVSRDEPDGKKKKKSSPSKSSSSSKKRSSSSSSSKKRASSKKKSSSSSSSKKKSDD